MLYCGDLSPVMELEGLLSRDRSECRGRTNAARFRKRCYVYLCQSFQGGVVITEYFSQLAHTKSSPLIQTTDWYFVFSSRASPLSFFSLSLASSLWRKLQGMTRRTRSTSLRCRAGMGTRLKDRKVSDSEIKWFGMACKSWYFSLLLKRLIYSKRISFC